MSYLPILTPGYANPVRVPCRLPAAFTFSVFLPSRGVRECAAWLTSTDPLHAEIDEVRNARGEADPRGPCGWELDADEQRRADDAAADVLHALLTRLSLNPSTRQPIPHPEDFGPHAALRAVARCWLAEEEVFCATCDAATLYDGLAARAESSDTRAMVRAAGTSLRKLVRCDGDKTPEDSPAMLALSAYVDLALAEVVQAQHEKAEAQQDAHPPEHQEEEDEDGSERIRAPRSLDVPTLKALAADVDY